MASPEMMAAFLEWKASNYDFRRLLKGYLDAAGFTASELGEPGADYEDQLFPCSGEFTDSYDVELEVLDLLSSSDLMRIKDDLTGFHSMAFDLVEQDELQPGDWEAAGRDFHYTRCCCGSGFWDGDWSNGDELANICDTFPELNMYGTRNDSGDLVEVYFM